MSRHCLLLSATLLMCLFSINSHSLHNHACIAMSQWHSPEDEGFGRIKKKKKKKNFVTRQTQPCKNVIKYGGEDTSPQLAVKSFDKLNYYSKSLQKLCPRGISICFDSFFSYLFWYHFHSFKCPATQPNPNPKTMDKYRLFFFFFFTWIAVMTRINGLP